MTLVWVDNAYKVRPPALSCNETVQKLEPTNENLCKSPVERFAG